MLYLITLGCTFFTFVFPLAISLKSLTVEGNSKSYKYLINYWIYYVILQWIEKACIRSEEMAFSAPLLLDFMRMWLFYGKNNNLQVLNNAFTGYMFHNSSGAKRRFESGVDFFLLLFMAQVPHDGSSFLESYYDNLATKPDSKNIMGRWGSRKQKHTTHGVGGYVTEWILNLQVPTAFTPVEREGKKKKVAKKPSQRGYMTPPLRESTPPIKNQRGYLSPPLRASTPPTNILAPLNLNRSLLVHQLRRTLEELPAVLELKDAVQKGSYPSSVFSSESSTPAGLEYPVENVLPHVPCSTDNYQSTSMMQEFPHLQSVKRDLPAHNVYTQPVNRTRLNSMPNAPPAGRPDFKIDREFFAHNKHKLIPKRAQ